MTKILTKSEVLEQFGTLVLNFSFYTGNHFVFSNNDRQGNHVSIFIHKNVMVYVGSDATTSIDNAPIDIVNGVRFLVLDKDFHILYQD